MPSSTDGVTHNTIDALYYLWRLVQNPYIILYVPVEKIMNEGLLSTKLYPAPLRPDFVSRERLFDYLNNWNLSKITLISAPAGFGKTSLMAGWVGRSAIPIAWLKLSKTDNQVSEFIRYIYASLGRGYPDFNQGNLPVPDTTEQSQIVPVANLLLIEIASYPNQILLVLDDYHLIENQSIHAYLEYLIEHLPPQAHIFLITRIDPPLPLSRWRGRGELQEVRAADLKFQPDEIKKYIDQVLSYPPDEEQLALITQKTEGWITGIKLAALSLSRQNPSERSSRTLNGNQEYIADYLTDEVLSSLSQDVQSFLLQTSILRYLSGDLCQAVTGRKDSQDVLENLVSENIFLSSLDETRSWFQYHQLFAELLRKRLYQTEPEHLEDLLERAIDWHEQHGLINEAVQYAIGLKDDNGLISIIERHILFVILQGEFYQAQTWLNQLSREVIWERPLLCVASAWITARDLSTERSYVFIDRAEVLLNADGGHTDTLQQDLLAGHIAALRASLRFPQISLLSLAQQLDHSRLT